MRSKKLIPAAVALTVALGMGTTPAWAYFTDTHHADGGLPINTPTITTGIEEFYGNGQKHVTITNQDSSNVPVYVRAKVFGAEELAVTADGTGWSGPDEEGWYLYADPIEPGGSANELLVSIDLGKLPVKTESEAQGYVDGDNFNVIVIYEAIPAPSDGSAPDWSKAADNSEGGN